jgi:arylsulfatase
VRNRSHTLTVELDAADGIAAEGVLLAMGSALGGWSLHFLDGRLHYVHNLYGKERYVVAAPDAIGAGRHIVAFAFEKDDGPGGTGTLSVDGQQVATADIPTFTPSAFNGVGHGLTCGYELGPAVGTGYEAPAPFNGTILRATVDVRGPIVRDPLAELAAILLEQ